MRGLAYRRYQRERIKAKRRRIQVGIIGWPEEMLIYLIDTPKPCSCLLCGNLRQYEGPTRQELQNSVSLTADELMGDMEYEFACWDAASDADFIRFEDTIQAI